MREHQESILKGICLALCLLIFFQVTRAFVRCFPFFDITIPAIPELASDSVEIPPKTMGGKLGSDPKMVKQAQIKNSNRNNTPPSLPPLVQARIDQVTNSEIFAQVAHPLPMALLGIAGDFAFLRSASGSTGVVKEGDTLDDMKLLRIGVNRVLIELNGKQQELTIFSGYGSESLLPTSNESPHESPH